HATVRVTAASRGIGRQAASGAGHRPGQSKRRRRLRGRRLLAGPGDENVCPGNRGQLNKRRRVCAASPDGRSCRRRPRPRREARPRPAHGLPTTRSRAPRSGCPCRCLFRLDAMTLALVISVVVAFPQEKPPTAEERGLAYLAREVPRWSPKNKCYSCHNNADAARALYAAKRLSLPVPDKALDDTTHWLLRPADWAHNGGEGPFNGKVLST